MSTFYRLLRASGETRGRRNELTHPAYVFCRYVVGWMIAPRESAELAHQLIAATCDKEDIARGQLTLHADRGASMRSKPVALLLVDLGVTKSHSQLYVRMTIRTRKRSSRP